MVRNGDICCLLFAYSMLNIEFSLLEGRNENEKQQVGARRLLNNPTLTSIASFLVSRLETRVCHSATRTIFALSLHH